MNKKNLLPGKLVRREFVMNLTLILVSLLLIVIGGEIWLRLIAVGSGDNLYGSYPQGILCKPEPLLGWIGKPNVSGILSFAAEDTGDMHVTMNAQGFWDSHHVIEKPAGSRRVIFLGDSFTIGFGISKKDRFADLVRYELPSNYEVINMGMWGYSTDQELIVLTEKGLQYSPDIIVLSLFLDDLFCCNLFSVNNGLYIKPKFSLLPNNNLELRNVPVPDNHGKSLFFNMIISRIFKFRNLMEVGSEFEKRGWFSVFDRKYLQKYEYTLPLRLLNEIYAVSNKHDAKFLLVIIPYKYQLINFDSVSSGHIDMDIPPGRLDLGLPQKVLKLFCKKTKIPVLDLLPVFKANCSSKKLFFKKDLHWTVEGHRIAAKEIVGCLKRLGYI